MKNGFTVILPQEECAGLDTAPEEIFRVCKSGVEKADTILAILDGPDADSGTCWEVGFAYGLGKQIVGVRTDFRKCEVFNVNIMLHYGVTTMITDTNNDDEILFKEILSSIDQRCTDRA